MKIINIIQRLQLRGAEIFACQLSEHLINKGHEVIVVSIFEGDSPLPFKGEIIKLNRPSTKRLFDVKGWKLLKDIVEKFKPDIIQANAADTLKFSVSSKFIFRWRTPIIYRNANKTGDFIDSKLKWHLNNFYLSKVDLVISVSNECKKDLVATFDFDSNKVDTVEIGVERKILGDAPTDLVSTFKRGPVLTHIGGFVPEKNHIGLINIFERVLVVLPDVQLLLLGKGKLEDSIKEKVKELGLDKNVHFLGYRTDVLEILRYSNGLVLPSLIEGLPAVILEAMYCETPVVAYDVGGIGEVVRSGKTGWLIRKNNEEDFLNSILEVLRNSNDARMRIAAAKDLVSEKFLNENIAQRFLNCYSNVLQQPSAVPNQKMKILQLVTKRQYRGAELFAAELSTELIKLGHEVTFAGIYENEEEVLKVTKADNRDLIKRKKGSFSFSVVKELVEMIKEVKPDVIQCNGSDTLKYMFVASYFVKNVPIVYRNISIISEWISEGLKKDLYRNMFRRISYVTSVGDEALADFIRTYNFSPVRTKVIRRGIPVKQVNKELLKKNLRRELGINKEAKLALHIGNFSPEKNHRFLIDVFSDLKKDYPNIKLVCVGSGVLFEEIKKLIAKKGLTNNIILLGFRKDIPELLAASDCLVLSSKVEGVPGVILEAATQRIPTVAVNVGGVSEALVDRVTGYLINGFNREEFKDKLLNILLNDDIKKEMGENAFKMISNGYDPTTNARKFEHLYQALVTEKFKKKNGIEQLIDPRDEDRYSCMEEED